MPVTQFYIKNDKWLNAKVVELQVDGAKPDEARDKVALAFATQAFLNEAMNGDAEADFDFIPHIQ